jgi:Ca-activated chloride channel family protein
MMPSPFLTVRTDRPLIPAGKPSTRYLLVRLGAPQAPPREGRAPVNVSLVLDRSGSMEDDRKFTLARRAVDQALGMLRSRDSFSVVVYDDRIDVLAPSSLATDDAKQRALEALDEIEPRGATNLGAGWLRGCEQVASRLARGEDGVSRCLLLTDGLANRGIQDRGELAVHAAELQSRGVATSTFGVGADFDERLLRDMAHEGGGNFYFIEGAAQIPGILTSELGEAIEVTVRRAALEITLPPGADAEPVSRFRHRRAHGDNELRIDLGDLVSEQQMAVVIKVAMPAGETGAKADIGITVIGRGVVPTTAVATLTYASDADDEAQPRDREVDREVARVYAALARAAAVEANRVGHFSEAAGKLQRVGANIAGYAGDDATLRRIASELQSSVMEFSAPLAAQRLKGHLFAAENAVKSRDASGRAQKGPECKPPKP